MTQAVVVSDARKIMTVLKKYGPVEIVNATEDPAVEAGKSSGAGLQQSVQIAFSAGAYEVCGFPHRGTSIEPA
jgi:hypothetical protein